MLCKELMVSVVAGKQSSILAPKWLKNWALMYHAKLISNSNTPTVCAYPISPSNKLAAGKSTSNNKQFVRPKFELQKVACV